MADLLTHIAIGHLLKRVSPWPTHPLLFALGTTVPDLVGRAPGLALYLLEVWTKRDMPYIVTLGFDAFHMPIPFTLACLMVAWMVPVDFRRTLFWNLLLGGYLHFGVDVFQSHIDSGYRLFFPLSWVDFELGWIGSEDSLYVAVPLALGALGVEVWYRRRQKEK